MQYVKPSPVLRDLSLFPIYLAFSIAALLLLLLLLLLILYGGVGAWMSFGYLGESLIMAYPNARIPWVAFAWTWLFTWILGLCSAFFNAKTLLSSIKNNQVKPCPTFDALLVAGYATFFAALLSIFSPYDLLYFGFVLSGGFFAAGIGLYAFAARNQ